MSRWIASIAIATTLAGCMSAAQRDELHAAIGRLKMPLVTHRIARDHGYVFQRGFRENCLRD
jgi:hypothetical protein